MCFIDLAKSGIREGHTEGKNNNMKKRTDAAWEREREREREYKGKVFISQSVLIANIDLLVTQTDEAV